LKKSRKLVAAIAIFSLCIDALSVRSLSVLAPFIRSGLSLDEGQFGIALGTVMAGTMLISLPVGSMLGHLDIRWAFSVILATVGVAFFGISLQDSFMGLLVSLFILGMLRAGIIPLVNRVLAEQYARGQRGVGMGIVYAAVPLGGFLGAVVLPLLGEYSNWNNAYRLLGIVAIVGGMLAWKYVPRVSTAPIPPNPLRGLTILRSGTFCALAGCYGVYALSLSADAFITLYLVDAIHISAVTAGIFFGLIQLTGVGGRVLWGVLADRLFRNNRWWLLVIVNWLAVVSFIMLISLRPASPWWMIAGVMIVVGLSAASSWGILSTLVGDVVGLGSIALATSVIYFLTNISDITGPIVFGTTLKLSGSYHTTLSLFMGIATLTAMAFTWLAWLSHPKPISTRE
jgi:MFS transporter, ACS family, hexuronate transporter